MLKRNIIISGITKGIGASIASFFLQNDDWNVFGFARDLSNFKILKNWDALGSYQYPDENTKIFQEQVIYSLQPFNSPDKRNLPSIAGVDSVDVRKPEQIKQFSEKVIHIYKSVDPYDNYNFTNILINNIGIYKTGSLFTEPDTQWQELFETNLNSAYYLTKYLFPTLKKGTHIFNICSIASKQIIQEAPSYSITKMALYGLTNAMRQELEPLGIKVTAILPGAVNTHSWKDAPDDTKNKILPPKDIARLIWRIYHLSPQSEVKEVEITPLPF